MIFYLYTHTRLDTNEVFYVGIGRTDDPQKFIRAFTITKRSKEWSEVVKQCKNNFKVDVVSKYNSHEECCAAEIKLIQHYGRKILNEGPLVNKAPGGHKWRDTIKVYQYDLNGNYIAKWASPKMIENVLKINNTSVYRSCRTKGRAGKYMFRTYKSDTISPWSDTKCKEVYQFSLKGEFIKQYPSIVAASKEIGSQSRYLKHAIKNFRSCKGFYWMFTPEYCVVKRLIYQYTLDGVLVNTYTSLNDVKTSLNLSSINSIDNAIKGLIQKQAYGCIWKSEYNVKVLNNKYEKEIM